MDDAGNVTQDSEQNVDEEISIASSLKEDTERWKDDGKDDLKDIAARKLVSIASGSDGIAAYDAVKGILSV